MLSEKYCQNLELSICVKKRQIQKLQTDKFVTQLLMGVGWTLFIISQFKYLIIT